MVGNHPLHAHCLPLEALSDLGVFGLAAWGLTAIWLLKVAKELWPSRPAMATALLVIPVHNLVDFSLFTSSVAVPVAVLVGWSVVLVRPEEAAEVRVDERFRWVPAVGGAVAVGLALLTFAGVSLKDAARGEAPHEQRLQSAIRAAKLVPWDAEAVDLVGEISLESGKPALAREGQTWLEIRQWQRPRSAARAQLMGRLAAVGGDAVGEVANLWRAHTSQPYDGRRREDFTEVADGLKGRSDATP